jgi:hypothetical protein
VAIRQQTHTGNFDLSGTHLFDLSGTRLGGKSFDPFGTKV